MSYNRLHDPRRSLLRYTSTADDGYERGSLQTTKIEYIFAELYAPLNLRAGATGDGNQTL